MRSILKRFGAAGVVLLILNEVRGLILVGLAVGALFGADRNAEAALVMQSRGCPAVDVCAAPTR